MPYVNWQIVQSMRLKNFQKNCCFIDLVKAFDTLNQDIRLDKLKKYGFRCPIPSIVETLVVSRWLLVSDGYAIISSEKLLQTGVLQR